MPKPIPEHIRAYAWEHGALWPLTVKQCQGEGSTLGYLDATHGPVPKSADIEVRYEFLDQYKHADRFACELEKEGYQRVLVIRGWPREGEVGK